MIKVIKNETLNNQKINRLIYKISKNLVNKLFIDINQLSWKYFKYYQYKY